VDRHDREEHGATLALALLGGMAAGALAMYLTDPEEGPRRRAVAQDAMRGVTGRASGAVNSVWQDASSRLSGLQESARSMIGQRSAKPIDNHVLEARVRAKLSRVASNADAIEVEADAGRVTLSGLVVPQEREAILDLVQAIPGVEAVRARLDEGEDEFPTVPVLSVLALAGGAILGYYGLRNRSTINDWMHSGLDWLSHSMEGLDLKGMLGGGMLGKAMGGKAQSVERSIDIKAAPEAVFQLWSRYENFPHFMSHVIEVRDLGDRRSHWVVRGPAGAEIEWTSELTRSERPNFLAWESEPGAAVENSGAVWLEAIPGGTRATVRMNYRPPAGALGDAAASLLGSDPESVLEEDLIRMREFIERGKALPAEAEGGARQILH
jgi:uncharacterized membrane protein